MRDAIALPKNRFVSSIAFSDIDDHFYRDQFVDDVLTPRGSLGFFQRNNPVVGMSCSGSGRRSRRWA
jgi:hypothetical protein